jgi:hypothetical protein
MNTTFFNDIVNDTLAGIAPNKEGAVAKKCGSPLF